MDATPVTKLILKLKCNQRFHEDIDLINETKWKTPKRGIKTRIEKRKTNVHLENGQFSAEINNA